MARSNPKIITIINAAGLLACIALIMNHIKKDDANLTARNKAKYEAITAEYERQSKSVVIPDFPEPPTIKAGVK
ncbi:hypothetical protein [Pseudomonas sp. MWU12-2037]|uniref:hypothetical protein n=1 Tax=Pseudomonas sp. MWU12-2037 TaxID=2928690 RepID=UPI0020103FE7|nr:hypothetical protein [Pseudomonas sp. MWU12-2037]